MTGSSAHFIGADPITFVASLIEFRHSYRLDRDDRVFRGLNQKNERRHFEQEVARLEGYGLSNSSISIVCL